MLTGPLTMTTPHSKKARGVAGGALEGSEPHGQRLPPPPLPRGNGTSPQPQATGTTARSQIQSGRIGIGHTPCRRANGKQSRDEGTALTEFARGKSLCQTESVRQTESVHLRVTQLCGYHLTSALSR